MGTLADAGSKEWYNQLEEFDCVLINVFIFLLHDITVSPLGTYPRKINIVGHKKTCTLFSIF